MSLEEREQAVLEYLRREPHASNRRISEELGLTISQVTTSIKAIEAGNRAHVLAVLDNSRFGYSHAWILVRVRNRAVDDVAVELAGINWVQFIARITGSEHELLLSLRIRSVEHLGQILREQLMVVKGADRTEAIVVLDTITYRTEYAAYVPERNLSSFDDNLKLLEEETEGSLDALDQIIISELQLDGRATSEAIARNHGLKAGTVRYRIKNLESRNLMRFITLLDPRSADMNAVAFVQIKAQSSSIQDIVNTLSGHNWMPYLFSVTGEWNICGIIVAQRSIALAHYIEDYIANVPGVEDARAFLVINNYKTDLRWAKIEEV